MPLGNEDIPVDHLGEVGFEFEAELIGPARGGGSIAMVRGLVESRLGRGLAGAALRGREGAHELAAEDGQVLRRAAGY